MSGDMSDALDLDICGHLRAAIVNDWFTTMRSMTAADAAAFFATLVTPLVDTKTEDELRELADDAGIEYCEECGASLDDGEGYDGLCGTHADIAEQQGRWT